MTYGAFTYYFYEKESQISAPGILVSRGRIERIRLPGLAEPLNFTLPKFSDMRTFFMARVRNSNAQQ